MSSQNFAYASSIIGQPVHNSLAQEYGHVSDIIFSASHRRAVALVVKKGGFLGIGADHFVLPWDKVLVNPNTQRILVEADRKTVEDTPLVDLDALKKGDLKALGLVYSYYGVEAFWEKPAEEAPPVHQNYQSGQDIGERLPTNEGSHQITKHYPGPRGSHTREEVNYDKMKGIKNTDDTK